MTAIIHNAKHAFVGGVTTTAGVLKSLGTIDPRHWTLWYEDWSGGLSPSLAVGDFEAATAENDIVGRSGGFAAVAEADAEALVTQIALAGSTGLLNLDLETDSTDKQIQLQSGGSAWAMEAGVPMVFEARFRLTAATLASHSWCIGLAEREAAIDETFAAGGASFTADNFWGVYGVDSTGSTATFAARIADVQTTGPTFTAATATWYTVSLVFDGVLTRCFLDGAERSSTISTVVTNVMTPTVYMEGGAAEDYAMAIDYMLVAKQTARGGANR